LEELEISLGSSEIGGRKRGVEDRKRGTGRGSGSREELPFYVRVEIFPAGVDSRRDPTRTGQRQGLNSPAGNAGRGPEILTRRGWGFNLPRVGPRGPEMLMAHKKTLSPIAQLSAAQRI